MALKISLRPDERVVIAGAVLRNGKRRCELIIENRVPIMREKDLLSEEQVSTPCQRIYFVIQLMYFDEDNLKAYHSQYWQLVGEVVKAAPSMVPRVDSISEAIVSANYYKALGLARELIDYEKEVVNRVIKSDAGL